MRSIRIGERRVGPGHPAYVIAEAGSNFDGELKLAHELVDVAADAGADAVKFQVFTADTLYSRFTPRLKEMDEFGRAASGLTPYELMKTLELPVAWLVELWDHAEQRGLDFLATPFHPDAVTILADLGVKAFKIGSYELTYYGLLRAAARHGRPLVISTGNSDLADVERAVATVVREGNHEVLLLHCVSQYPPREDELNLSVLSVLSQAFKVPVGFSDHTLDATAAVVAVALGACCFEKHFTLDRSRKGPDHPTAMEPADLRDYIATIRKAERSLGSPVKRVQAGEEDNHRLARRSLHAAVDIPAGTPITAEMLTVKRPALGIHPFHENLVIGRTAKVAIKADEWITWDMI